MSLESLASLFPHDSSEEWKLRVEKELKGKSFDDFLIWKSLDGFEIASWQNERPSILPELVPLATPWKSLEPIYLEDAQLANKSALDALMVGAEAIWFEKSFKGAAAQVVSNGIDQSVAPVFINGQTLVEIFRPFLKHKESVEANIHQSLLINGLTLRERGATIIQELAFAIAQWLEVRRENPEAQVVFKLGYGTQYLSEIAKTRAFRWLYQRLLIEEGEKPANPEIIGVNLQRDYAKNDEHTNILRATSAGMSAVVGGAQFVMIEPWNKAWNREDTFSARISRNIHNLMRDEGKLDKNLNPSDGSYFLENLTVHIAESAWAHVQKMEGEGGFKAYALSGQLKQDLQNSIDRWSEAYQQSEKVLLGVNKFKPAEWQKEEASNTSRYELLPDYFFVPTSIKE